MQEYNHLQDYSHYVELCEQFNVEPINDDVYHWEAHYNSLLTQYHK